MGSHGTTSRDYNVEKVCKDLKVARFMSVVFKCNFLSWFVMYKVISGRRDTLLFGHSPFWVHVSGNGNSQCSEYQT